MLAQGGIHYFWAFCILFFFLRFTCVCLADFAHHFFFTTQTFTMKPTGRTKVTSLSAFGIPLHSPGAKHGCIQGLNRFVIRQLSAWLHLHAASPATQPWQISDSISWVDPALSQFVSGFRTSSNSSSIHCHCSVSSGRRSQIHSGH